MKIDVKMVIALYVSINHSQKFLPDKILSKKLKYINLNSTIRRISKSHNRVEKFLI